MKRVLFPALLVLASCAAPPPPVYVPQPQVPPPQIETRPLPPVSRRVLIWQPGHYDWTGGAYSWVPGRYIDRASAASGLWQSGSWASNGQNGWIWMPAHWN